LKIHGYTIDLESAVKSIIKNNYNKVAFQLPEGLKSHMSKFVEFLEDETGATVIVSADPCFGACDVANCGLKTLGVEFVIQIGHTPIPEIKDSLIPTIFINALSTNDVTKVVEKSIPRLECKRIGVVTTAQHIHTLNTVKEILEKHNFEPVISEGDERISAKGQILGCNFSAGMNIVDEIDSFLFIGSGNFHPVGLSLSSKKPVIAADPYENTVKKQELQELKDTILRQRYGAIANSKNAKKFGILIGLKQGQQRMELSYKIKELLDDNNKKSIFIAMDHFSPDVLQSFRDVGCFVSTACPRIAIDDYLQYKTPIITPVELEIVLDKKKWEDYQFDQITSQ